MPLSVSSHLVSSDSVMNKKLHGIVFYDGSCPLCQKEITSLEREGCLLDLKDIHTEDNLPVPKETLLKELHAITASGNVLVGFDANLFMWRHGHYAWLARITSLPGLYQITREVYNCWAEWRYESRYGKNNACDPCSKQSASHKGSAK